MKKASKTRLLGDYAGRIFGKDFEEIEGMQQGYGAKTIKRAPLKIGDKLKYKNPNLWHHRHSMTVTGLNPLRVQYANTGRGGIESESNVMIAD